MRAARRRKLALDFCAAMLRSAERDLTDRLVNRPADMPSIEAGRSQQMLREVKAALAADDAITHERRRLRAAGRDDT